MTENKQQVKQNNSSNDQIKEFLDFPVIAKKWQKKWEEAKIFEVKEEPGKKKYYCLEMYPYPSGKLHMGHVRNYSIGDAFTRFKRMNGFNVLYPMGYDAFGLPAENAAIKHQVHPEKWTRDCIENMKVQQKALGLSYDWKRQLQSIDTDYYKWNQWIFLQLYKKGIAYKKEAEINWCESCGTVLANEQVEDGKCWRCHNLVEQKPLEQWYYKIKDYAEELLQDIDKLEYWPEKVKTMQKNWIGKSHGTEIFFDVVNDEGKKIDTITTFTTRADTVYGITYLVLAVEHPKVIDWTKGTRYEKTAQEFIREVKKKTIIERTAEGKEKNGMFLGVYFINPVNGDKCPLWVADYALFDYGTGAVMAVPTHDQRDFEFAKKYNLPLKIVIQSNDGWEVKPEKMARAFTDEGKIINSDEFNGMNSRDAIESISIFLEKKNWGKRVISYKIRDWLISRQRYWGTPIPIIYCKDCGTVPIPEKDLPVILPKDAQFTGQGNPLATSNTFVNVKCSKCNKDARRETDTMDTFMDSSWYFFGYTSPDRTKEMINKDKAHYWMPVDQYIGGIEHAILHLLYARFYTKVLRDLGLTNISEPFKRLLCQGMVLKDGAKMSKSLGNVVEPNEIIDKYGPDTARLFILFAALPEKELDWSDQGVNGCYKFLRRIWTLTETEFSVGKYSLENLGDDEKFILGMKHKTIKKVTEYMQEFKISTAIGAIMEYVNELQKYKEHKYVHAIYGDSLKTLALLISPFAPHLAEEMWEKLGHKDFISIASWPEFDETMIDEKVESLIEQVNNTILDIRRVLELTKINTPSKITLFVSEQWKYDVIRNVKLKLAETRDIGAIMKAAMMDEYKKEISQLVPKLIKDQSKIPLVVLDQKTEYGSLITQKDKIEKEFKCDVLIVKADESTEAKAKSAMPNKPAILVG